MVVLRRPVANGLCNPSKELKRFAPSSIHNYSILFLITRKDEGPYVFKLVEQTLPWIFSKIKSKASCFNYY